MRKKHWLTFSAALWLAVVAPVVGYAAADDDGAKPQANTDATRSAAQDAFLARLRALKWVRGPTTVDVVGDSKLVVPEGYLFLNQAETDKFLEMNQNLSSGTEMMIAPESLQWSAYFSFANEGYVKDDEKIDAAALLKTMQEGAETGNAERRKRGWPDLHVVNWAVPPAYNSSTKRLEWATTLRGESGESVNFSTKILGRKGHTTVIMAASPDDLQTARPALNTLLAGYDFIPGGRYSEYVAGDKVAEYGLAALVLGGAAAIATKKGFWAILAGFFAAAWKFLIAGAIAVGAWLRKIFAKKGTDAAV